MHGQECRAVMCDQTNPVPKDTLWQAEQIAAFLAAGQALQQRTSTTRDQGVHKPSAPKARV
jgi:hypothetical protein